MSGSRLVFFFYINFSGAFNIKRQSICSYFHIFLLMFVRNHLLRIKKFLPCNFPFIYEKDRNLFIQNQSVNELFFHSKLMILPLSDLFMYVALSLSHSLSCKYQNHLSQPLGFFFRKFQQQLPLFHHSF